MTNSYGHLSVMPGEVAKWLITDRNALYVDATLGLGGHAAEILKSAGEGSMVLGIDWDPEMISLASENLKRFGKRARVVQANFANIDEVASRENISGAKGVLFDLGVSSLHFDKPSRGFSFSRNGELDMRINPANPLTASAIVNQWPFEQIEHLIRVTGERNSSKIARLIIKERKREEITSTGRLKNIIEKSFGHRKGRIHPATRTFLALRLAVNSELENILKGIARAASVLSEGGRICVISFHSLEDKIVKETFKSMESLGGWKILTKKPVSPSEEEIRLNYRARSAKMRVIEKNGARRRYEKRQYLQNRDEDTKDIRQGIEERKT